MTTDNHTVKELTAPELGPFALELLIRIANRVTRMESRLVRLMEVHGLDERGDRQTDTTSECPTPKLPGG